MATIAGTTISILEPIVGTRQAHWLAVGICIAVAKNLLVSEEPIKFALRTRQHPTASAPIVMTPAPA